MQSVLAKPCTCLHRVFPLMSQFPFALPSMCALGRQGRNTKLVTRVARGWGTYERRGSAEVPGTGKESTHFLAFRSATVSTSCRAALSFLLSPLGELCDAESQQDALMLSVGFGAPWDLGNALKTFRRKDGDIPKCPFRRTMKKICSPLA